MGAKKLSIILSALIIVVLLLCGCSEYIDPGYSDFNAGNTLTPEELEQLSNQIFSNDDNTTVPFDARFYWTDSGSKLHLFSDCGHLQNSAEIRSGDENDIRALKKAGFCSSCLKKAGKTEADFNFPEASTESNADDPTNTSEEAPSTATVSQVSTGPDAPSYEITESSLYFWTESGSKLHLFSNCGHLQNSADIRYGTKEKLSALKKTGVCTSCLKNADKIASDFDFLFKDISTEPITTTETTATSATESATASKAPETDAPKPDYTVNESSIFYWTASGIKYHLYRECSHLKNSANVISGDMKKLNFAQKDGPCATCLKKAGLTREEFIAMLK